MNPSRAGWTAAALHWVHAGLLCGLIGLGWYMVGLPKGPDKALYIATHKSLGLLAIGLLALRLAWPLHRGLGATAGFKPRRPAASPQRALYLMLFLTPLCGFLSTNFGRHPLRFFALTLPKFGTPDDAVSQAFALCHRVSIWLLLALVALHVANVAGWLRVRPKAPAELLP